MRLGWLIILALFALPIVSQAQCKGFTRKKCMPLLAPYISNGQVNSVVMFEGDSASLKMTFYSEQSYRMIVCSQQIFDGGVYFKVRDSDKKLLYNSADNEMQTTWDFQVNTTQDLWVDVFAPQPEESSIEITNSACVTLAVGIGTGD